MANLRILTEQQVRGLVDPLQSRAAVLEAYRLFGTTPSVQSDPSLMVLSGPPVELGAFATGKYRVKGATLTSRGAAGVFLYARKHPYIYIWSTATDEPIGLVACDWLSQLRVALTVAIAIDILANTCPKKISLFGAGKYAMQTCALLAQEYPEADLNVIAAHRASAESLARAIPCTILIEDNPRVAIQNADVVITLTTTKEPIVRAGWMAPGSLLLSMGSVCEADISVLRESDALIVDDLAYACLQGDLAAWLRNGDIDPAELRQRIRANIGEVVAGLKPGRKHADERLLGIMQGLTACDVALAKLVLDRAQEEQVGERVTL